MIEAIARLGDHDTRDELGLGSIRDGFAELFFPGTTTLQTRARYFLFIPWLYRTFLVQRVSSSRIHERMRQEEIKLIRALQAAGETEGIIGQRSGAHLHRFPSSIYWNGLRAWGILRFPGTREQYHRSLDGLYARWAGHPRTDEGEPVGGWGGAPPWDRGLPAPPGGFPAQVDLKLRQGEAEYLRERLLLSCTDSLLATMVDRCPATADVEFPWFHPRLGDFPREQQVWLAHARSFSEAMHGAVLLYNLMLAEMWGDDDLVDGYRQLLDEWRAAMAARAGEFAAWARADFWALVLRIARIPLRTQRFVDTWLDLLRAEGWQPALVGHAGARAQVREREVLLKGGRSRLESRRNLEMWSGAAGTGRLDYRWGIGRRLVNDILNGLGGG